MRYKLCATGYPASPYWQGRRLLIRTLILILFVLQTPSLIGCSGAISTKLQSYDPQTAAGKAIELYDGDGDRKLAAAELTKSPALAASIRRVDTNRDGALSTEEIQARFEELNRWAKYIGLDTGVTRLGRPLAGAQVTLVPEPFMGDGYPTLSGTTDEGGRCSLVAEGRDLPGIPVGFYTARIVHPAQHIDTVRGVEIAEDTTGSRLEISL